MSNESLKKKTTRLTLLDSSSEVLKALDERRKQEINVTSRKPFSSSANAGANIEEVWIKVEKYNNRMLSTDDSVIIFWRHRLTNEISYQDPSELRSYYVHPEGVVLENKLQASYKTPGKGYNRSILRFFSFNKSSASDANVGENNGSNISTPKPKLSFLQTLFAKKVPSSTITVTQDESSDEWSLNKVATSRITSEKSSIRSFSGSSLNQPTSTRSKSFNWISIKRSLTSAGLSAGASPSNSPTQHKSSSADLEALKVMRQKNNQKSSPVCNSDTSFWSPKTVH